MENSTKAILITAGVFFALLTLSLVTIMLRNLQVISDAENSKKETREIQEWNAQWEAYNKEIMYGADVITVVNKAAQVNNENASTSYQITIKITKENGTNVADRETKAYLEQNKLTIFTCTEISYNSETGHVNKMTFQNTGK